MSTISDLKYEYFKSATGEEDMTKTLADLEYEFYSDPTTVFKSDTSVEDATSETVVDQLNALLAALRTSGVIADE